MKIRFFFLSISVLYCTCAYSTGDDLGSIPLIREVTFHEWDNEIVRLESEYNDKRTDSLEKLSLMYRKRADLKFAWRDYQAALKDYQKIVFQNENSSFFEPSHLLYGICGSMFSYQCLDENELAEQEFNKLVYHVALMGEEIEKVDWIKESPIYIAYLKNHKRIKSPIFLTNLPEMTPEEFCQFQCAGYAIAASSACLKVPNVAIAALCGGCIWGLEQLCSRCCKGEGFWKNCVKPLRRLFHDPSHPENPAPHPYE